MNRLLVSSVLSVALASAVFAASAFRLEIVSPRCESAREPVGVVRARPRFTWALKGADPERPAAGAELRLAASPQDVAAGRNLVWAKKTGSCFDCLYDGAALRPVTPYWWQVRLVHADGAAATAWSAPQRFIPALRSAEGWEGAQWVGEAPHAVRWRDFDYQVKFKLTSEAFGVLFRAADDKTGYMWQINVALGKSPLLRPHVFQNGIRILPVVDLAPFFPQGLDWAKEHVLRIETRGTRIRTLLDGVCVDTRTDGTFAAGTIGVRAAHREEARVAEISVRDADGKELLLDRFQGHIMPAFRYPVLDGNQLVVKNRTWLHPGILPKNAIQLRRPFRIAAKPVVSAIASVSGYGFYELRLNGAPVDPSRVLAPGMAGGGRALFDTYDVTASLRPGAENEVGIWLAAGYSDDFSRFGWHWLLPKQAILHLAVAYADGTRDVLVTDGSWEVSQDTEIESASIYNGETIDARRREKRPSFGPVTVHPARQLTANDAPPVRKLDPRRPVRIVETRPGVFVADFGQNRAGFVAVRVKGPRGTTIRLHTSELLGENGEIDPWTNGIAQSTDTFVLAGTGEVESFCPRFTYHGFQFVEITGWPGRPTADDLTAWAVHADMEPAGSFTCSDKTLNAYMNAAHWSMRSNFMSYPTDCCMRGERTPCQMDSQAYEDAAIQFYNMTRYYEKWLNDIGGGRGNPDWTGDSATLPWRLYRETGDARILAERYDDMKGQVDADVRKFPDLICTSGFGDWCAPNKGTWKSYFNDVEIVNTSIFCEMCRIVAESAAVLGKSEDAAAYRALHAKAKAAFHAKFFDAAGNLYGDGSQTTAVLPLAFGIVPDSVRAAVAGQLVRTIREKNGGKVDVGIFGMRYLGDVLCDVGAADVYLHAMVQPEYPGFGHMIARGATTLWEQWTYKGGMNTHNHAMFSGAASSLMTRFAGIRPGKPGFSEVVIQPAFPQGLDSVSAARETVRGRVAVSWRRKGETVELTVERPPLTPTWLVLPGRKDPIAVPAGVSTHAGRP
ncbi:MAG: family 78 glycoside hydrolase catalytic domain [Kiritimatiellia bacterium]